MKIALDVDSVIADVIKIWLKNYCKYFNVKLEKNEINTWDFWKILKIDENEFEYLFTETWKQWKLIPPTEENIIYNVRILNNLGILDIVTGRTKYTLNYVKNWLKLNGIEYNKFVYVPPNIKKSDLNYDIFIDDSPSIILNVAENNKLAFIYNQPWNKNVNNDNSNIYRINDLNQAIKIIKKIIKIKKINNI